MEKTVGIIGGMGPEATVDFMKRIIQLTPAEDDGDHIRMIVDNNPKIPSRIKAIIEGTGETPVPALIQLAKNLESWGADFLAMPCNTAHFYYEPVNAAVHIPVLNMIELTVDTVSRHPDIRKVGFLGSTAVIMTEMYVNAFIKKDVEVINPEPKQQASIMSIIKEIKAGSYKDEIFAALQDSIDRLIQKDAQALLIACTELSMIADLLESKTTIYDSMRILVEKVIKEAATPSSSN